MKNLQTAVLSLGLLTCLSAVALADTSATSTTPPPPTTGSPTTTSNGGRLFDSQNCASSSYGHFRAHVHL